MDKKYEAILYAPRPVSEKRAKMPRIQRAAQFAPFAALTGLEDMISETARQTEQATVLDESQVRQIDFCLRQIRENLAKMPKVEMKVFRPDLRKSGGSYALLRGKVIKIDEYQQKLWLDGRKTIYFWQIIQLFIL